MKISIHSSFSLFLLKTASKTAYYFSTRKLTRRELRFIRLQGLHRFLLPSLNTIQRDRFIADFDSFWDDILAIHGKNPYFWRNSISSKMQEWENSAGYLALVLFTLSVAQFEEESELIILPDNVEEAEVWRNWALARKWKVMSYGFGWPQRLRQEIENILRFGLISIRSIRKKLLAPPENRSIRKGTILLITVYYRQALKAEKYEDLFFGRLHDEIACYDRDTLYLGDTIDTFQPEDAELLGKQGKPVSIYSFLRWRDIFFGIWAVFTRAPKFNNVVFCGVKMSHLMSWHSRKFRYSFTLTAEYFYRAVRQACQRYDFCKMIHVYEGNVYERAAVQAFREESSAHIDAYSHAVLYPLNLKLHASPSEAKLAPEPNRYLVCSDYARGVLKRLRNVKTEMISTCSLRSIPQVCDIRNKSGENILVVLDGLLSTAVVLDWLYQNANVFEGRRVIIRAHPNVGWDNLQGQCPNYRAGVFCLSQQSLKDDFENAFCVLYRQSSVGIQALLHGIPVINLKIDQPLSGDPLDGAELGRIVVTNAEELSKALSLISTVRKEILSIECYARNFAMKYFDAPRPELLLPFVEINP